MSAQRILQEIACLNLIAFTTGNGDDRSKRARINGIAAAAEAGRLVGVRGNQEALAYTARDLHSDCQAFEMLMNRCCCLSSRVRHPLTVSCLEYGLLMCVNIQRVRAAFRSVARHLLPCYAEMSQCPYAYRLNYICL